MSAVVIAGNTSGSITLNAPDVAGTTTLNLPTVSGGTLVTSDSSGNVGIGGTGSGQKLFVDSGSYLWAGRYTSSNVVATALEVGNSTTRAWEVAVGGSAPAGTLPAGGIYLYDQTAGQARFSIDTSGNMAFNSGYGSLATAYGCRAWVNFNGTGTVAIRASGNVSSVTDNGVGDYGINFTNAMPNTNYSVSGLGKEFDNTNNSWVNLFLAKKTIANTFQTTNVQVNTQNSANGQLIDCPVVTVQVFR